MTTISNFLVQVFFPKVMMVCEALAPLTSVLVFLAPIPTIFHVRMAKSVGDLPLLPYTMMVTNAFLWFVYGFIREEPKLWTANAVGFYMAAFYFLEFVRYCPKRSHTLPGSVFAHFHFCFAGVIGTLVLALLDPSGLLIGHLAGLSCIVMFASPLAALPTVLKTKSAEAIPVPYTLAVMTDSTFWSMIGIFDMQDANIYIPSLLGLALSSSQLALNLIYGNGPVAPTQPMSRGYYSDADMSDLFSPVFL